MSVEPFWSLLLYQLSMSLLTVGGVIALASEQHRTMVLQNAWLTDAQFQASITLAQVAPGPNVLFLALWGWHVGLNAMAGSSVPGAPWVGAVLGLTVCMVGSLGPSSVLAVWASRWSRAHADRALVKAIRQGLAPMVVGAMLATAWVLVRTGDPGEQAGWVSHFLPWGLAGVSALLVWQTRLHLLLLLAAGALVGLAHHAWRVG